MGKKKREDTHVGDYPMERATRVSKSMLSCRELAKVLGSAWHHVIEQAKHDAASRFRVDRDVELYQAKKKKKKKQTGIPSAIFRKPYGGVMRTNTFAL